MEHPFHQFAFDIPEGNHQQVEELPSVMPNLGKGKGKRLRDWDKEETSALLECVNLPQFRHQKRNQSYMKWDAIAEEIQKRLVRTDSAITGKRCKDRMKTLRGYWQQVRTEEKNADVTEDEWHKSNGLAVDWWYKAIGDFQAPRDGKLMSTPIPRKPVSTRKPRKSIRTSSPRKSATKQIAARFNSLNNSRRSTFLDLIFCALFLGDNDVDFDLNSCHISDVCRWLSKVQNRGERAIYEDVFALVHMGLVSCQNEMNEEYDDDAECILIFYLHLSSLKVHQKFFKKVMDRNPAYDTRRIIKHEVMVTLDARCVPSGITMLHLKDCKELEEVDLNGFQKLRLLWIFSCPKLYKIIGWECLNEIGYIKIYNCPLYEGHPPLHKVPSLREFHFWHEGQSSTRSSVDPGGELDVSGCVCLRRLEINFNKALSSICGLEGLHSLIELDLSGCIALQNLPDLGHMKDLTHLSIVNTSVDEIKGVEKLLSLKELSCWDSKLKMLPDLSHLPHLEYVWLGNCPLTKDPSSPYFDIDFKRFTHKNKHVDVSDTSDTELELSNEDLLVD